MNHRYKQKTIDGVITVYMEDTRFTVAQFSPNDNGAWAYASWLHYIEYVKNSSLWDADNNKYIIGKDEPCTTEKAATEDAK